MSTTWQGLLSALLMLVLHWHEASHLEILMCFFFFFSFLFFFKVHDYVREHEIGGGHARLCLI